MLPSATKLSVSAILLAVFVVNGANCGVPCYQDALNTAADLTLYFVAKNLIKFIQIPEVDQRVGGGLVKMFATGGSCGGISSLQRVGDYFTGFSGDVYENDEKPIYKKIVTSMKGKFKTLYVEFNRTQIVLGWCKSKGALSVKVSRTLFEVVAESSDKHRCLMDLKLLKFHKFGPMHMTIKPAEGWLCAAFTEKIFNNLVVPFFSSFAKQKIKEKLIKAVHKRFPSDNGPLCLSPYFDIEFM